MAILENLFQSFAPQKRNSKNRIFDFSVDYLVIGLKEDYEPARNKRLEAIFQYNWELFEDSHVKFRVAWIEGIPPQGKALLGPSLMNQFPFLRTIPIASKDYEKMCETQDLQSIFNLLETKSYPSSECDFALLSGRACFFGRDTATYLVRYGLEKKRLYRAKQIDIQNDLDFSKVTGDMLERKSSHVHTPGDAKRHDANTLGDFLLVDKESFPKALSLPVENIGHIYHIHQN